MTEDQQAAAASGNSGQAAADRAFSLEKLYVKDLSFVSPRSPGVFMQETAAESLVDLRTDTRVMPDGLVEVTLTLNCKAVAGQDPVFEIEIAQAGLFRMENFTQQEKHRLAGTVCPGILFTYARVAIADAAFKGGFPSLLIQPVDFDSLYQQGMAERIQNSALMTDPVGMR